jgi:hypothetical protein
MFNMFKINKKVLFLVLVAILVIIIGGRAYAAISGGSGGGIGSPNYWKLTGTVLSPVNNSWTVNMSGGNLFSGIISDLATTTEIAKGDIIVRNATGDWTNMEVGTDGYVLTASSSAPFGLSFEPSSGGTGVISINGVSTSTFTFTTGTTGTDFTIATSTDTLTFNFPTASAANRGLLSSADWTTFNNKVTTESDPVVKALTGIITSNGSAISSITDSHTNWDTAYTDRLKWDGGATGLTAATGRTSLELGSMALEANTGSSTITTLGTIGTGVWNGTAVDVQHGGTNKTSWTQYLIPYADTTTSFSQIAIGSSGQVLTSNGAGSAPTFQAVAAGASFWNTVAGSPARNSSTTVVLTGDYTSLFAKGIVLKWTEGATVRNAMVSIPSTYSAPTTTITFIGDQMASIDASSLKYASVGVIPFATKFAVAGTIGATGTDVANAFYSTQPKRVLGADLQVGTAGTTNSTTIDINKNGTTMFTTKPTLASTVAASPTPFTADSATSLALNDKVTIDVDAVQTTAAIDLYVQLYLWPTLYNNL